MKYSLILLLGVFIAATMVNQQGCKPQGSPTPVPSSAKKIKMGYLVKQPEEPWFQLEWKFADMAAREFDFEVIKIGATDGEKVLAAIDSLTAAGAQGVIVCPPDTRLGPAVVAKAKAANLKLLNIDDQFVGADGLPMQNVHFHGLSAVKVGEEVGAALHTQMKIRNWTVADTAACVVTFDELATAKERTDGAESGLTNAGFPADHIFHAAQRTSDIPGAFDAVNVLLSKQGGVKHWLIAGMNDNAVLGAVRALESRGYGANNALGIGINGTDCIAELEKRDITAFYGSFLLEPKRHGYETAVLMYQWLKNGVEPPLDMRTTGTLITRENFRRVLREQGIRE